MTSKRNLVALAAALLLFAGLFTFCKVLLASATFIEAVVQLDHSDRLQFFFLRGGGGFTERHSAFSEIIPPHQIQTAHIRLHYAPMGKLRLDLGDHSGTVRLHKLTIAAPFAKEAKILLPEDIRRLFRICSAGTSVRLKQDYLEIQTGKDSQLVCDTPLLHPKPLLLYGLPLLFSLLLFAMLQEADITTLAPFADLRNKRPSIGENIEALDGLRGIALLMVVADHTWGWFSGAGRSGVWIFMTLSGFLLARPFVQQPERAVSLSFLRHFFLRRIRRIMPVYYAYIIAVFLFAGRVEEAAVHFLFLQGNGHLWVVPQEMLFYLLTPPVMLICLLLFRLRPWLVMPGLAVLIILAHRFGGIIQLRDGMHSHLPLYFGVFLGGVLAAWIHASVWQQTSQAFRQRAEPWASALTVLILLFFILFSHEREWGGTRFLALLYFPWFAAAAAMLILAALAAGQSAVRLLSWTPLRALSLVSFSVYVVHTLILEIIRRGVELHFGKHLSGAPLFISTLLLSYLFACVSYTLLERPFLRSA